MGNILENTCQNNNNIIDSEIIYETNSWIKVSNKNNKFLNMPFYKLEININDLKYCLSVY